VEIALENNDNTASVLPGTGAAAITAHPASKTGASSGVGEKMKVLVVDDERLSSHNLGIQLRFVGEEPQFSDSENCLAILQLAGGAAAILAVVIGNVKKRDTAELLADIQRECPSPMLLVIPAGQQVPALSAKLKPQVHLLQQSELNYERLTAALQQARQMQGLAPREHHSRIISASGAALFRSLTGHSKTIMEIRQTIEQVAKRDVTVLVMGESGTGKEVVARNLHYHSGRGKMPFIPVNCAAIAPDRYGVELFGQAQGPGVPEIIPGLLDRANGGTLYFDEVSELPLNIQVLLLRFIEDRSFQRIGSGDFINSDVHIITGSGKPLEPLMQRGKFRADLYYRLSLMPIELPPLRKRLEDLPDLVRELLRCLESKGYNTVSLNAAAIEALQRHHWPGNVRELANLVERLCIMHSEGVLGVKDLPLDYQLAEDTEALLEEIEALATRADAKPAKKFVPVTVVPDLPKQPATEAPPDPPAASAAVVDPEVALATLGRSDQNFAMLPLNEMMLKHYLFNFEKQMLVTALDDCANMPSFAAERLAISEEDLNERIKACQL
jgi:sigma-54 dependent transcriptional regulator, flagellar regulatory protein